MTGKIGEEPGDWERYSNRRAQWDPNWGRVKAPSCKRCGVSIPAGGDMGATGFGWRDLPKEYCSKHQSCSTCGTTLLDQTSGWSQPFLRSGFCRMCSYDRRVLEEKNQRMQTQDDLKALRHAGALSGLIVLILIGIFKIAF